MKFNVIIACHNRKALTLRAVEQAVAAAERSGIEISFTVYDDGSRDGTADGLRTLTGSIQVLSGDGSAFWARSMALAERTVLETRADAVDEFIVWLNDDVDLDVASFGAIRGVIEHNRGAVVVGAMRDPLTSAVTYSGLKRSGLHPLGFRVVAPSAETQTVETFNGNLVIVPIAIARKLGGIDSGFSHALADIDYGLRCRRAGVAVLLAAGTQGTCARNAVPLRGSALNDWRAFKSPKGGGNYSSMRRILRKTNARTWGLFLAASYCLWWARRVPAFAPRPLLAGALRKARGSWHHTNRAPVPETAPLNLKVLHVLGSLRPSGMERMLASAACYFRAEGIQTIVIGRGVNHPFAAELSAAGYDVRTLKPTGSRWKDARMLSRAIRDASPDVVHIHSEGDYLRTVLASRIALGRRGKIVRTIHAIFDAHGKWRVTRHLQAVAADRTVSALIAPSPAVAETERRIGRDPRVIYNWVDDRFFTIRAERLAGLRANDPSVALLVGNCSSIKNHELALRALLSTTHVLIHIGDERDASPVELALLQSLEDQGRLLERGAGSPESGLLRADYFMLPSLHEGMSVALAEAVVVGLPAVISDARGLDWARQIESVRVLPRVEHEWTNAVREWCSAPGAEGPLGIDLSAARGAREYADVYREPHRARPSSRSK